MAKEVWTAAKKRCLEAGTHLIDSAKSSHVAIPSISEATRGFQVCFMDVKLIMGIFTASI
jgi:hypothetical protein